MKNWISERRGKFRFATAAGICVVIAGLVAACETPAPPIPTVDPVPEVEIDDSAAAERLAESVRIRTISHSADAPVETRAFEALYDLMVRHYPLVHAKLKREVVAEHSLLYTWPAQDADAQPRWARSLVSALWCMDRTV